MLVAMESLVHNPEKLVEEILQMIKDKKITPGDCTNASS